MLQQLEWIWKSLEANNDNASLTAYRTVRLVISRRVNLSLSCTALLPRHQDMFSRRYCLWAWTEHQASLSILNWTQTSERVCAIKHITRVSLTLASLLPCEIRSRQKRGITPTSPSGPIILQHQRSWYTKHCCSTKNKHHTWTVTDGPNQVERPQYHLAHHTNKNLAIANRSRVSCAHNTVHWGHLYSA